MMHTKTKWLNASVLSGALLWSSLASAHPDLDQAAKLTRELELEPALTAYQHAIDSGTLTRDELIELLVERALVLYGLRRQGELIADLVWLSAVQPSYEFDRRAAPELVATWKALREQGRGPMGVQLSAQVDGSLSAHSKLTGTVPAGATSRVVVREGKSWSKKSDELWQVALPGETLELYAEAVALGGVVVATDHSPTAPLRLRVGAGAPAEPVSSVPRDDTPGWGKRNRGWLIGGAIVLAGAAATAAVLWMKRDQDEDPSSKSTTVAPTVRF